MPEYLRSPESSYVCSGEKVCKLPSYTFSFFSSYVTGASPILNGEKSMYAYAVTFVHKHRHIFAIIEIRRQLL